MGEITKYWTDYCRSSGSAGKQPLSWSFGGTAQLADQLGALVAAGKKTGTSSGWELYQQAGEKIPEAGALAIILDGNDQPLCIIKNLRVEVLPFGLVTAEHARQEGEGDLTLGYWREVHQAVFSKGYAAAGVPFNEGSLIVYEVFEVIYQR